MTSHAEPLGFQSTSLPFSSTAIALDKWGIQKNFFSYILILGTLVSSDAACFCGEIRNIMFFWLKSILSIAMHYP